jgi:hypothetical protein
VFGCIYAWKFVVSSVSGFFGKVVGSLQDYTTKKISEGLHNIVIYVGEGAYNAVTNCLDFLLDSFGL